MYSAVSRCDVDKSDFMHFVKSVRWHCTILMITTSLNENIDRDVRGVCDIRPELRQNAWCFRNFIVTVNWENWQLLQISSFNQTI